MSTKSNRSSGTQHNQRGVAQGMTLVDPKTGLPVTVVLGNDGKYRLAVDAQITANIGNVNVDLDGVGPSGDNVYLVDNITGNKFKINADGSIDTNVELDALDGDNVAIKDSNGDELDINNDGSINTKIIDPTITNIFNEITNVSSAIPTTIISYVAPADIKLLQIDVSGTNIAYFEVLINGILNAKKYTHFQLLNETFNFNNGLSVLLGQTILVRVTHNRPDVGNFNANILIEN